MKFRPCIDIHNGKVKQIVGGSLRDEGNQAAENFVSVLNAGDYARMYAADGLAGGHVILLNKSDSPHYEETKGQALLALRTAPGTLQVGGGITPENAGEFLDAGASHVIVTSYVFREGKIDYEALERMKSSAGAGRLVLDLSARRRDGIFYVVTDRWQRFTSEQVTQELFERLAAYCSEFLVHGVDVEGRQSGPDEELAGLLGEYAAGGGIPVTYAGGIRSEDDIELIRRAGREKVDFTVGSALDLFGGKLPYKKMITIR